MVCEKWESNSGIVGDSSLLQCYAMPSLAVKIVQHLKKLKPLTWEIDGDNLIVWK